MHQVRKAFLVSSPVVGSHSAGYAHLSTDLVGCASALEFSSSLRRAIPPPDFYPLQGRWVNCLVPEAPLIMDMQMGPKVFLAMPDACGTDDKYQGVLGLGDA